MYPVIRVVRSDIRFKLPGIWSISIVRYFWNQSTSLHDHGFSDVISRVPQIDPGVSGVSRFPTYQMSLSESKGRLHLNVFEMRDSVLSGSTILNRVEKWPSSRWTGTVRENALDYAEQLNLISLGHRFSAKYMPVFRQISASISPNICQYSDKPVGDCPDGCL